MKLFRAGIAAMLMMSIAFTVSAWNMEDGDGQMLTVDGKLQYRGRVYNLDFNNDTNASHLNRVNYFGDLSLGFKIQPTEFVSGYFELNRLIFLGQEFRYNTIQTGEDVLPEDYDLIFNVVTQDDMQVINADGTSTVISEMDTTKISNKLPLRRNTDEAWEFQMRQAWFDINIPKVPLKFKFGRQPFILGNGIYTNTNIATVFGYQVYSDLGPGKPFVRLGSMKFFEGIRESYDGEAKMNNADDVDMYFVDGNMAVPNMDNSKVGAFLTLFNDRSFGMDRLYHYNLGLTANLSLPMGFSLSSEFDYQTGKKDFYTETATDKDFDWTGFAFMAKLNAPALLDSKLRLSGEYGIGSGDDPDTADFEGYVGVGPFYPYAWAYEYRFIHSIHNASNFYAKNSKGMCQNLAPGMENTTYLKATGVVSLPWKLQYIVSPIWLGMTQEGETFGYEFDNIINVPFYKNFSYQFIFAYVIPSDTLKDRTKAGNKYILDNSYGIRSQFQMTF